MICWIFNQYINTPDTPGGSRHYELAKIVAGAGHELVLFGARPDMNKGLYYDELRDGFTIIWLNINKYFGKSTKRILNMVLYSILILNLYLRSKRRAIILKRPDVIIGSSVHLFGAYAAYLLSRFYRVPFIFEVRDLWPQTLIDMGTLSLNSPISKAMRFLEKRLYERSVLIISSLPFACDYICSRYDISPEKITWLPNGVNLDMFPKQTWPDTKDFVLTYVGAHGRANALGSIIAAAEILQHEGVNDVTFNFIGKGPLKSSLIEEARKKGLEHVTFNDPVSKADLFKVARVTHAFIVNLKNLPLYRYGISLNKIYDYMAMARPVIIGCSAGNNPIEKAHAGICVKADDAEALSRAIVELKKMPGEEAVVLGKNGRNYVEKHHDYKMLGKTLEKWLVGVVE